MFAACVVIKSAYHFDANWKVLLLVALLFPLLLWLGFWQLERAEEKRSLQQLFEARAALPALTIDELASFDPAELAFRRVALHGSFDNMRHFLLDNQVAGGRVGYHLLTPFYASSGLTLIVNRGWLAGRADRSPPELPVLEGGLELMASVYIPQGETLMLGADDWSANWPVVVQNAGISKISQKLGRELFPYLLRIEPGQVGALQASWPAVNTRPEKHTGYAVQWFLMSLALVICGLYASFTGAPAGHPSAKS